MKRTPRSRQASMKSCEQPAESVRTMTSVALGVDRQLGQGGVEHHDVVGRRCPAPALPGRKTRPGPRRWRRGRP